MTELKDNYPLWNVRYKVTWYGTEREATVGGHESDIERLLHEAHAEPIHVIGTKLVSLSQAYTTTPKAYIPVIKPTYGTRGVLR